MHFRIDYAKAELAGIIDGLYERKKKNKPLTKKLVFIIGNGIHQVDNLLNDDEINKRAAKRHIKYGTPRYTRYKWQLFEYARYYTANYLPSYGHCCIWKLVNDGLCRDIITTNYDLFFDSIWKKYSRLRIKTNPVLTDGEYDWDCYYSHSVKNCFTRYWKIHGSLSHVVFNSKVGSRTPYIFALPRFTVSSNEPGITTAYQLKHSLPFLGYESEIYYRTNFKRGRLDSTFIPYIDWSFGNNRSLFQREISGARAALFNPRSLAAVVMVGFRGFYDSTIHPWNEELVENINHLLNSGYEKIYMAVHENQYAAIKEPSSMLMQRLDSLNHCWTYRSVQHFFYSFFSTFSKYFPISFVEDEYRHWKLYWFLVGKEKAHKGGP